MHHTGARWVQIDLATYIEYATNAYCTEISKLQNVEILHLQLAILKASELKEPSERLE